MTTWQRGKNESGSCCGDANAIEGLDTETVMRLYELSRDNLYQIRKRFTAKIRETVASVLVEMDAPDAPG